jgi:predicted transcriptional regulator
VTIATGLTAAIVAAYLSNNAATIADLPNIIRSVHQALSNVTASAPAPVVEKLVPAVSVKKSATPDYIVCLEDGKQLKMLKRHLRSVYNLTPDEYRARWGLPPDYPMTAANYAALRSSHAKAMGLGRQAAQVVDDTAPVERRGPGRPKKSAQAAVSVDAVRQKKPRPSSAGRTFRSRLGAMPEICT